MNLFKVDNKVNIGDFLITLLLISGIPIITTFFITNIKEQYEILNKPNFAPPNWIFGVVWPILYLLIAIATYRIYQYKKEGVDIKTAYIFNFSQLALNFFWPYIFFLLRLYGLSFIVIVLLVILSFITFIKFYKIDKISALLIIPYIIWLSYASVLNFYIWKLNEM
ncbi:TspO/MBR family protein [Clostridium fallax]|uniref:TspO and MBR related proteins n=1 Tax=Clostridium fallax TaxID=1533 RepID=A0A1M4WVZ0_9CLOT|nr:TspO/MBR family protein [Clostridium fallax]SHE85365.1 TspO and MBR related proteins [Clostridium fallax]SQB07435.1 tryptophan-rich sensory protein [Clostridium fallax]